MNSDAAEAAGPPKAKKISPLSVYANISINHRILGICCRRFKRRTKNNHDLTKKNLFGATLVLEKETKRRGNKVRKKRKREEIIRNIVQEMVQQAVLNNLYSNEEDLQLNLDCPGMQERDLLDLFCQENEMEIEDAEISDICRVRVLDEDAGSISPERRWQRRRSPFIEKEEEADEEENGGDENNDINVQEVDDEDLSFFHKPRLSSDPSEGSQLVLRKRRRRSDAGTERHRKMWKVHHETVWTPDKDGAPASSVETIDLDDDPLPKIITPKCEQLGGDTDPEEIRIVTKMLSAEDSNGGGLKAKAIQMVHPQVNPLARRWPEAWPYCRTPNGVLDESILRNLLLTPEPSPDGLEPGLDFPPDKDFLDANPQWLDDPKLVTRKAQQLREEIQYLGSLAKQKEHERMTILCFRSYKESLLKRLEPGDAKKSREPDYPPAIPSPCYPRPSDPCCKCCQVDQYKKKPVEERQKQGWPKESQPKRTCPPAPKPKPIKPSVVQPWVDKPSEPKPPLFAGPPGYMWGYPPPAEPLPDKRQRRPEYFHKPPEQMSCGEMYPGLPPGFCPQSDCVECNLMGYQGPLLATGGSRWFSPLSMGASQQSAFHLVKPPPRPPEHTSTSQ